MGILTAEVSLPSVVERWEWLCLRSEKEFLQEVRQASTLGRIAALRDGDDVFEAVVRPLYPAHKLRELEAREKQKEAEQARDRWLAIAQRYGGKIERIT